MGKKVETVKYAKIGRESVGAGSMFGDQFYLGLGPEEIAILLAMRFICATGTGDATNILWGLYKKSLPDEVTASDLASDTFAEKADLCAVGSISRFAGAAGAGGYGHKGHDDFSFPYPLVVTRDPVLWTRNIAGTTCQYMSILYFRTEKISKEDLVKMMVKDHA